MRQLSLCELSSGGYCVRPVDWAGVWDKDGKLEAGSANILFGSLSKYECQRYMLRQTLHDLIEENPTFRIIPIIKETSETTSLFGYTKGDIVGVVLDECCTYMNTVYLKSKHSEEQVIMDRKVLETGKTVTDETRPIIVWEKCIVVYIE